MTSRSVPVIVKYVKRVFIIQNGGSADDDDMDSAFCLKIYDKFLECQDVHLETAFVYKICQDPSNIKFCYIVRAGDCLNCSCHMKWGI